MLFRSLSSMNNLEESNNYIKKAIEYISREINDLVEENHSKLLEMKSVLGFAYYRLGVNEEVTNNFKEALKNYLKAKELTDNNTKSNDKLRLKIFDKIKNTEKHNTYNKWGTVQLRGCSLYKTKKIMPDMIHTSSIFYNVRKPFSSCSSYYHSKKNSSNLKNIPMMPSKKSSNISCVDGMKNHITSNAFNQPHRRIKSLNFNSSEIKKEFTKSKCNNVKINPGKSNSEFPNEINCLEKLGFLKWDDNNKANVCLKSLSPKQTVTEIKRSFFDSSKDFSSEEVLSNNSQIPSSRQSGIANEGIESLRLNTMNKFAVELSHSEKES